MKQIELSIENKIEELHRINGTLEELGETWEVPMPILMNINLCMEEALTNIIFYAFKEEQAAIINLKLALTSDNEISVTIEDEGIPFNPLESVNNPDTDAELEDRRIGGLGIFFITQFMDRVTYERIENRNQLIMYKSI